MNAISSAQQHLSPYYVLRDPVGRDGPTPPSSDERAGQPLDLRNLVAVLRKHRRLIFAITAAAVFGTALFVFTTEPIYRATTTIDIERDTPNIAPVQGVQQPSASTYEDPHDFYETQYQILKNRALAARVIRSLSLDTDSRFVGSGKPGLLASLRQRIGTLLAARPDSKTKSVEPPTDAPTGEPNGVGTYLGSLTIEPVRSSRLVKISFDSPSAQLSATVANQHVDQYVAATLEQRLGMAAQAKEFLEIELGKSRQRVVEAEAALNKFRKDHDLLSVDGDNNDIVSQRLSALNDQFGQAQADRIRLEGQYRLIERRSYESLPDVANNASIEHLKQEAAAAATERAELEKKYKAGYPKMAAVIARESQLQAQIASETRRVVEVIRSGYLAAKNREQELAQRLEEQRQAALRQKDSGADFDTLKRDVETARGLYANLLQRLKDVDVAKEVKISNVSVIEPAIVPSVPFTPNKRQSLLLAAILGLSAGIALAFFLENLDDTVKTADDLEKKLGIPALGVVPAFDRPIMRLGLIGLGRSPSKELLGPDRPANAPAAPAIAPLGRPNLVEFITHEKPSSVIAEAYRTIRTAILLSTPERPPQVVLFTSGASGEGKTVTTVNEAITLGQAGARVLVVDADVRRPRLHRLFDLPNGHGLSSYLAGQSTLDAIVFKINGDRGICGNGSVPGGTLSVIPSGPIPPDPAELLGSDRMRELLELLRKQYDYVLLDTPPVLPVTDAVVLSRLCDGVVVVVRGQKTPTDLAAACRDRLTKSRARIIGAVLNGVDLSTGEYEKHYRYYYSYYAEDPPQQP